MMVMKEWLLERLYQPALFFLLLPVFYIALGSGFGLAEQSFNGLSVFILYVFVLLNQMLENIFLRIPKNNFEFSRGFVWSLELLTLGLILYFGWRHSWLAALVLFFYALIIQSQFVFSYYHLEKIAALSVTFLKVVVLNSLAFYIHAHFILYRFFLLYLGLVIPFYLFELSRSDQESWPVWRFVLVTVSYLIGLVFLGQTVGKLSFLLLLSLPFAALLRLEFSRKTTALFAYSFSFLYISLQFLGMLNQ